jgi:hypothetical protein
MSAAAAADVTQEVPYVQVAAIFYHLHINNIKTTDDPTQDILQHLQLDITLAFPCKNWEKTANAFVKDGGNQTRYCTLL